MDNSVFAPVPGKRNLFRHVHTGELYARMTGENLYYPVDEEGNPRSDEDQTYPPEDQNGVIIDEFDPELVNWEPSGVTRRYALSNEDSDDILNQPDGIDWL